MFPFSPVLAPIFAFVAVVHWLLCSMTVEVSGQELRWYFGRGFWRKRIVLSDIARVERVRLPWWYGIGIKYTPRAWVYLVSPGDGVEVHTVSGETVRIGTDRSRVLTEGGVHEQVDRPGHHRRSRRGDAGVVAGAAASRAAVSAEAL